MKNCVAIHIFTLFSGASFASLCLLIISAVSYCTAILLAGAGSVRGRLQFVRP